MYTTCLIAEGSTSKGSTPFEKGTPVTPAASQKPLKIVLVHGGFVDGSGWAGVYRALRKDGFEVTVVQNPTLSLGDDVAVTRRTIAAQGGPVLLAYHSC